MKQYCRYCCSCSYGDVPYCSVKEQTMSEREIKRVNNCKDFDFCHFDVITCKDYEPRKPKVKSDIKEMELF